MSLVTVQFYPNLDEGLAPTEISRDITPQVRAVSWTHSVTPSGISATVVIESVARQRATQFGSEVQFAANENNLLQGVGGYIVIRDANSVSGEALWWGRINRIRYNSTTNDQGVLLDEPIVMECSSWLSVLMQSSLVGVASTATAGAYIPGALFSAAGLTVFFEQLSAAVKLQGQSPIAYIGTALEAVWKNFARNGVIPAGLLDPSAGARANPISTRTGDPSSAAGRSREALSTLSAAVSAVTGSVSIGLPTSLNSFSRIPVVWDPATAALRTPSRVANHTPVPGWSLNGFAGGSPRGSIWAFLSATFGADPNLVEMFPSLEPAVPGVPVSTVVPGLGGATPVLVYRMKPLVELPGPKGIASGLFPLINAVPSLTQTIEASDLVSISTTYDDTERINGWFVHSPYKPRSQMKVFDGWGQPIFDSPSANVHGLRYYEANWPFYPGGGAGEGKLNLAMSAIAEYGNRISVDGHKRPSGRLQLKYKPALRAGHWYRVNFLDGRGLPGFYLVYAQSTSCSITVQPNGVQVGRSSVAFIRAKGQLDPPAAPPVPVPPVPLPGPLPV